MALFDVAEIPEWNTDASMDKLHDSIFSKQPSIKKKKGLKESPPNDKSLGQQSTVNQLEKLVNMRHAYRYQKDRKKKQLEMKRAIQKEAKKENKQVNNGTKKSENTAERMKNKKDLKEKKESSAKQSKPIPEATSVKKKEILPSGENVKAVDKEHVKKPKKKKISQKKEQVVSSPIPKKNRNKYQNLAGKGKRIDNLHIDDMKPIEAPKVLEKSPERSMEIDVEEPKKVSKFSLKRKLHENVKSDETITNKKPKLEPVLSKSSAISVENLTDTPTTKPASPDTPTTKPASPEHLPEAVEKKKTKKKTKKKKKKALQDDNKTESDVASSKVATSNKDSDRSNKNMLQTPTPQKSLGKKSSFHMDKIRSLLQSKEAHYSPEPLSDPKSPLITVPKKSSPKKPLSLKERMEEQLKAARFRYLNETLYTSNSKSARKLFSEDPGAFQLYHHGYQAQVSKWPANPVDRVITYVKARSQELVVADFGCGDAKLAQSVTNTVHSFDLVSVNKHVTVADSAKVPLKDRSVDIAVFSLSLMGTNFVDFLIEANRVLKRSGTLLIAEVVSRFEKVSRFAKKLEHLGFKLISKDLSNKMFVWFEFSKTSELTDDSVIPDMDLLPCLYKKR